jgi:signal transduction histidine kinase
MLCAGGTLVYAVAAKAAARLNRAISALTDIAEPKAKVIDIRELAQVKAELRRLERGRLSAQEDERKRIGLELHDDLQQKLALVRQDLTWLTPGQHRDRAMSCVDESIASTRRLVMDLRPPMFGEIGLPAALAALARQHQLALYRNTQKALNNALKHAHAQAIHISLSGSPGGDVVLEVVDDGVGFQHNARMLAQGHGLRGMHERAQAQGGHLEVMTAPGDGTAVLARLPWPLAHDGKG